MGCVRISGASIINSLYRNIPLLAQNLDVYFFVIHYSERLCLVFWTIFLSFTCFKLDYQTVGFHIPTLFGFILPSLNSFPHFLIPLPV